MRFGIICAMQEELDEIMNCIQLEFVDTTYLAQCSYKKYQYNNHEVIVLICGIGKVNAASATQALICLFNPAYIINVGVAGGLSADLAFGDVVIATDLVQHDMDVQAFGMERGQIPRMDTFSFSCDQYLIDIAMSAFVSTKYKVVMGRIVSGDQFIDHHQTAVNIHTEFDALACEMEGAAIAHVCYLNKIPFLVVRALSDMAGIDGSAMHSFAELKEVSATRAAKVVAYILEVA